MDSRNHTERSLYYSKSSNRNNEEGLHIHILSCLQNIQVNIDANGKINQINNLNKSINVQLSNQGFFWYQGT